jgi:hypothetical protein
MRNKHGWFALEFWATELEKKYPRTNLFALSNKKLAEMLLSLDKAQGMPSLPNDKAYFNALASAWVEVQHGGKEPKEIPDAYI